MATALHKIPALRVIKFTIYNFGRPLLGHHNYTLSLHGPRPGGENIFKKYINFTLFPPKITSPWDGGGGMKFTISSPLILQMLHILNLVKIGPEVVEKKNIRRTNTTSDVNT